MKVSDYIVEFLISKEIEHAFGYPGGMVMHLMDSFDKRSEEIHNHLCYHEQAAAFSACGYAQAKNIAGFAYATSGPGATNLMTGIANAYFDSIPTIFITGQVNTFEGRDCLRVRQKGFQEMEVVEIMKPICKYAVKIDDPETVGYYLEKAYAICTEGRPGPVVLDIPMDVQRGYVNEYSTEESFATLQNQHSIKNVTDSIYTALSTSKKPLIIAGNGINLSGCRKEFREFVEQIKIPVVTSMISIDLLPSDSPYNLGFIGAYGHRHANYLVSESDLVISIGSRLDTRQTGVNIQWFAPKATIIRIDIDPEELMNKIKDKEKGFFIDIRRILPVLCTERFDFGNRFDKWLIASRNIKGVLEEIDEEYANIMVKRISDFLPDDCLITTDVGQNQVWVAQSLAVKKNQRVLFSGGHGAMGYSLPAAIGAYYAKEAPVICFIGDGGLQMNIQELQFLAREDIPIKVIILNNTSLGMMRHFQEMYFNSNYVHSKPEKGYLPPNFKKIADAFGINYTNVSKEIDLGNEMKELIGNNTPQLINIELRGDTYLFPKLAFNKPVYEQDPELKPNIQKLVAEIIESFDL